MWWLHLALGAGSRRCVSFGQAPHKDFVQSLIVVDPAKRLTAQCALEHPFIARRRSSVRGVEIDISDGLRNFAEFWRVCLSMMAWSLSMEDRRRLRGKFPELDVQKKGSISLSQFKAALHGSHRVDGAEAERLFAALDANHDNAISYSEFLAAALDSNVRMDGSVLRRTFARFDRDEAGEITVDNVHTLLGDTFDSLDMAEFLGQADKAGNGAVCYEQFVEYMQADSNKQSCSKSVQSPTALHREKLCRLVDALADETVLQQMLRQQMGALQTQS